MMFSSTKIDLSCVLGHWNYRYHLCLQDSYSRVPLKIDRLFQYDLLRAKIEIITGLYRLGDVEVEVVT